ncbi:MAG: class I SAM-dependent methyltransferase [Sphingomonadales bacterium]
MTELLIHSMSAFSDIIVDALHIADARDIVEIGTETGGMSQILADYAAHSNGTLTCVDPLPRASFTDWLKEKDKVRHVALPSLSAFDTLANVDAWVVDGDHNWFTVYHELVAIDAACRRDGRPLLVFLHDVGWPWARRDLYYAPEQIPETYRHAHDFDGGVVPGYPALVPRGGFRGMGEFAPACLEGGPRNGVLTAIEDFLEEQLTAGTELGFAEIPGVFGLGVIFGLDAEWSAPLAELLAPFHGNALLQKLEANRLANYLRVIEFQDATAR